MCQNLKCKICPKSTNLQQPNHSATEQSLYSVYDSAKGGSGLIVPEHLRSAPLCHYLWKHSSPVSYCHCPLTAHALWTPRYFLSKCWGCLWDPTSQPFTASHFPWYGADHSLPFDAEAMNDWSYTFTPPECLHGVYRDCILFSSCGLNVWINLLCYTLPILKFI